MTLPASPQAQAQSGRRDELRNLWFQLRGGVTTSDSITGTMETVFRFAAALDAEADARVDKARDGAERNVQLVMAGTDARVTEVRRSIGKVCEDIAFVNGELRAALLQADARVEAMRERAAKIAKTAWMVSDYADIMDADELERMCNETSNGILALPIEGDGR